MQKKEQSKKLDIFEELDRLKEKTKREKQAKSYRLLVFNSLWQNGYSKEMGPVAAWVYVILGDKCTREETLAGKVCLFVYGGGYSKTIIKELAEFVGKSIWIIWRALKQLKKIGRIDYQTRQRVGTRIVVFPIPGAFEKHLNKPKNGFIKELNKGKNALNNSAGAIDNSAGAITNSAGAIIQPGLFEESGKENKQNSKLPETESPLTKTTTKTFVVACSEICQILKGAIRPEKVQNLIKDRDLDEMIKLARRSAEKATQNPVGLFITMVREKTGIPKTETKPIEEGTTKKRKLPYVYSITPDPIIELFEKKGLKGQELENKLWEVNGRYKDQVCHLSIDFDVPKEELSQGETARMVAIAKDMAK